MGFPFVDIPANSGTGDGSFRRSPQVELGVGTYSSTTAEAARTAPDPPIHPPKHPPCTAAQQHVTKQQYVSTFMQSLLLHRIGISMLYNPPPYRGPGTAPFDAPHLSSLVLGPVLSPITPCIAVWGGRGAVTLPRVARWRSGEPFQNGAY